MAKVNRSAKTGEFVSDEEAKANPDTTVTETINREEDGKVTMPTDEERAKQQKKEEKADNEMRSRTARYDQDLKERARVAGINPDNFETEEALGKAVEKFEEENGVDREASK